MLTLAPAYIGMCIQIYICDMCVIIAFGMPFAHFCSSVCGHVFGMPLDMLVAHFIFAACLGMALTLACCSLLSQLIYNIFIVYVYIYVCGMHACF